MFLDTLDALQGAQRVKSILVLTGDPEIAAHARAAACQICREKSGEGLNSGLTRGAGQIRAEGNGCMLIMPADLPAVTSRDIDQLLAAHRRGITLAPAAKDNGTNALVCSPPDVIPFRFGRFSAARHAAAAAATGKPIRVVRGSAFDRDLDQPGDLEWLMSQNQPSRARTFVSSGLQKIRV